MLIFWRKNAGVGAPVPNCGAGNGTPLADFVNGGGKGRTPTISPFVNPLAPLLAAAGFAVTVQAAPNAMVRSERNDEVSCLAQRSSLKEALVDWQGRTGSRVD